MIDWKPLVHARTLADGVDLDLGCRGPGDHRHVAVVVMHGLAVAALPGVCQVIA
jgi:hypothetical protein